MISLCMPFTRKARSSSRFATVERGSTLWNKGNPELCGAMYSMTAKTLTTASNISSSVQEISRVAMASAERYPVNLGGDAAWIYRKAFDHILAAYEGVSFPSDDRWRKCFDCRTLGPRGRPMDHRTSTNAGARSPGFHHGVENECLVVRFGQASWVQLPSWRTVVLCGDCSDNVPGVMRSVRIPRLSPAVAVSEEGDIYVMGGRHNKEACALADTIEIASGRMAWILRAFKAIVLVLVADAVPGGPLRLEHAKVPSFLNSSALSKAWLSDALRRRALFGKVPEAQETISRSHLELEQLGGSLPSSGSAIVLYAAHDASITISNSERETS
eukprot:g21593.t1